MDVQYMTPSLSALLKSLDNSPLCLSDAEESIAFTFALE